MVDLTTYLGRPVPTATQIIEVSRGSLRLASVIGPALIDAMRAGRLDHTEDLELSDGSDEHAEDAVFIALLDAAMSNIADWASDMAAEEATRGMVYDKAQVREFVRLALVEAWSGTIDPALLQY